MHTDPRDVLLSSLASIQWTHEHADIRVRSLVMHPDTLLAAMSYVLRDGRYMIDAAPHGAAPMLRGVPVDTDDRMDMGVVDVRVVVTR